MEVGNYRLHIGTAEHVDGTVEQGYGSSLVILLQLALGCGIEVVCTAQLALRQLLEEGVGLVILLLRIQDLCLLLEVDRLGVDGIGRFRLLQCALHIPSLVGLVALVELFLVDELGILVVGIVLLLCFVDGPFHVFVGLGKLSVRYFLPCPVDISVCSIGIAGYEAVDVFVILLSV